MADESDQVIDDDNRMANEEELAALQEQLHEPIVGTPPYVAAPAPGHDVHGIWHCFNSGSRSGYAAHAIALHWALREQLKIPTQLIPHRHMDIDIEDFPEDRAEMLLRWNMEAVGHGHLLFSSYPPHTSAEMAKVGPPLVPYIAYEATTVSKEMVELCNSDSFAKIWVVHSFVKQALVDSGVGEEKVHVAPPVLFGGPWEGMGITPEQRMAAAPTGAEDALFTFGTLGTWQERKGFKKLVRAFWSEFSREENVQLVIRTSTFGKNRTIKELGEFLTEELAEIAAELGDDDFPRSKKQAKIKFIMGTGAPDKEVVDWLGTLDCFVSSSFGEGLGIPAIWAKGQGVPMISTSFGALGELLQSIQEAGGTEDHIVNHKLAPVAEELFELMGMLFGYDSQWGDYETVDLADAMRMQLIAGRGRTDMVGADFVRTRHGLFQATSAVRRGLAQLMEAGQLEKMVGSL